MIRASVCQLHKLWSVHDFKHTWKASMPIGQLRKYEYNFGRILFAVISTYVSSTCILQLELHMAGDTFTQCNTLYLGCLFVSTLSLSSGFQ